MFIELRKNGISIPMGHLTSLLRSDFVPYFNPLKAYFQNLHQWDGSTDYLKNYASYVKLAPGEDRGQFFYHFKKWCVRTVKCALIDGYFNKQAFVLSDDGKGQNIGKSTWCRFLCPKQLSEYIAEDMGGNDKDSRLLLCKNFLINLDELAALARKEINQLKSQLSKDQINERLPYDRKNSILQRVASFIGSTNQSTFLLDETGSVRWLCFTVERIDFSYKSEFDMDNLWAQAYYLANDKSFDETMTRNDVIENEIRNKKFQTMTPEHELLLSYLKKPVIDSDGEFMTATDIVNHIQHATMSRQRLTTVNMGKALNQESYEKKKTGGSTLYLVQKINNL
ncbi:VapE domain-containing protein [[Muricauda] lutisoli]|uniref:Virulence-associated E family protein n=1 Tax=[Muricauda] lutisoli TaxID=2816035 RepID=A0ABS3EV17_9FLAO|nr:VapE domain-containing protein [[Muricauda] lutisoli]MBO0330090.1 virulence-associated E family protein [[Muricauda] lutisoli]